MIITKGVGLFASTIVRTVALVLTFLPSRAFLPPDNRCQTMDPFSGADEQSGSRLVHPHPTEPSASHCTTARVCPILKQQSISTLRVVLNTRSAAT